MLTVCLVTHLSYKRDQDGGQAASQRQALCWRRTLLRTKNTGALVCPRAVSGLRALLPEHSLTKPPARRGCSPLTAHSHLGSLLCLSSEGLAFRALTRLHGVRGLPTPRSSQESLLTQAGPN